MFTREEAKAIAVYLQFKRQADSVQQEQIEAALNGFWLERAKSAPEAASLKKYLEEQAEYLAAITEGSRD